MPGGSLYRSSSRTSLHDETLDKGVTAAIENRWVFEIAWEVANRVGSIYTVLRSKSQSAIDELGDQFCAIGPYNEECVRDEVELEEPTDDLYGPTVNALKERGIRVFYGRWLIDGNPRVILFDLKSVAEKVEEYRKELWNVSRIGSPPDDVEFSDALIFGFLIAEFLQLFRSQFNADFKQPLIVAHFHDWSTGVGLILTRCRKVDVSTVFTAHSTLLGRCLCNDNVELYKNLEKINIDKEAGDRGIYHRYCVERAATKSAHVFTTVSQMTALEAKHLLKRKPEMITPHGLNIQKFSATHQFQNLHAIAKEKISEFVRGHFYGNLDFDLDNTLYVFSAGRYEFNNKGVDLFIQSLAKLNEQLKASNSEKTVIAFLFFPARTRSFNVETLRGQTIAKQLRDTIQEMQGNIGRRIFDSCILGGIPRGSELMTKEDTMHLKRCLHPAPRNSRPPICTHNMENELNDPILKALKEHKLLNDKTDRVKVIFHPEFLTARNPLFNTDYDEFIRGCHLGVFPSYYEPWGYIAAQCTVMGIPSVSTNLSGFGCFMKQHVADPMSYGIYILDRRFKANDAIVNELSEYMFDFTCLTRRQRIIQRNRTERLSDLLSWRNLGVFYRQAHQLALHKLHPTDVAEIEEARASRMKYPRPVSEPPSPEQSEEEEDDVDEEEEEKELFGRPLSAAAEVQDD